MKNRRQEKILEIIEREPIFTQDDLQNALNKFGFEVTQSTVSRDIRELKLVKSHDEKGNYRYVSPKHQNQNENSTYSAIISSAVKSVNFAMNDVVIKCSVGMAQSVCVVLDEMYEKKMLGSIAGDDTVLIIAYSTEQAKSLCEDIKRMM